MERILASVLLVLGWIHGIIAPVGEWISNSFLGAIEETTRTVVRGWFNAGSRYIHTTSALILSAFSGQVYGKAQRLEATRPQRAWLTFWSQAKGTFNALLEREGLIEAENESRVPSEILAASNDDSTTTPKSTGLFSDRNGFENGSSGITIAEHRLTKRSWNVGLFNRFRRRSTKKPIEFDYSMSPPLFTTTSQPLTGFRRGLVEDIRLTMEVAIARTFAMLRAMVRKLFLLDASQQDVSASRIQSRGAKTPSVRKLWRKQSLWSFSSGPRPWEDVHQFAASDAILKAGYPLEEHTVQTSDGYILQLHRIPRRGARDVIFFQHGVLDTSLGWVAKGTGGSAAFACHDAGFDVWLANTRANPPRMHVDRRYRGGRYWRYSADELAMADVSAQIEHIHSIKMVELAAETVSLSPFVVKQPGERRGMRRRWSLQEAGDHDTATDEEECMVTEAADMIKMRRAATVDCFSEFGRAQRQDAEHAVARLRRSKSESIAPITAPLPSLLHESDSEFGSVVCLEDNSEDISVRADIDEYEDDVSDYHSPSSEIHEEDADSPGGLPYRMQAVGHSLGASCLLMHAVGCRMKGQPLRLHRLVLLSPAGFHPRIPLFLSWCKWGIPMLCWMNDSLRPGSGIGLRLPSPVLRWITFKLFADIRHSPALLELTKVAMRLAASGDTSDWYSQMSLPHYSTAAMPTVSLHTANSIAQWAKDGKFRFYDYGSKEMNLFKHGRTKPPSVSENYRLLEDLPVDLIAGTRDGLVPAEGVKEHERCLKEGSVPVTYMEFGFGHLEFTFGVNDEVVSYVLGRLRRSALDVSVRNNG